MAQQKLNRISEVLRSQGRTNKWIAQQLGKTDLTISRWCNNVQQPDLATLFKLAELIDVNVCDLIETKKQRKNK
ncbi:MAG: helix-turn-helix transcriptional regulator [Bacteroidota bacterium]